MLAWRRIHRAFQSMICRDDGHINAAGEASAHNGDALAGERMRVSAARNTYMRCRHGEAWRYRIMFIYCYRRCIT